MTWNNEILFRVRFLLNLHDWFKIFLKVIMCHVIFCITCKACANGGICYWINFWEIWNLSFLLRQGIIAGEIKDSLWCFYCCSLACYIVLHIRRKCLSMNYSASCDVNILFLSKKRGRGLGKGSARELPGGSTGGFLDFCSSFKREHIFDFQLLRFRAF